MTTTPAPLDIDTLKALEQAATPAPWKADTETRGDCVLWGPNGQFVANAQAEPHWLPAADGGKRAVMFDVDRRDVALIAAARNALPALLDELGKTRADNEWYHETLPKVTDQRNAASVQAEQWEKRYVEMLGQRDTAIQQHAAARAELAKTRAELDRIVQAVRFVHAEYEGRCVTCEERCDCLDLDDMALVGDCTHGNAEWPCTTIQMLAITGAANPATTVEPADEQQPECVQTATCCSTCLHDLGECCKPGHVQAEPAAG